MIRPVLIVESLSKSFGGLRITDDVTIEVMPVEIHAIIGPNGAGKTTLINQVAGILAPDSGRILYMGEDITRLPTHGRARRGLARTFQINSVLPSFSALENVAVAIQGRSSSSFRFFGPAAQEKVFNIPAIQALDAVGIADRADVLAAHLSHGERRALELAIAIAMEPKLLLLDEPMAGTSHEEALRLVQLLSRLKGRFPMVLIEHDMNAVFALADRISVLIYGRVIATDVPAAIKADPKVKAAYLGDELEC